jgi:beta-fructofuranosidase
MPRIVWLDSRTTTNVLQWPVEEVDDLRHNKITVKSFELQPGTEAQLMDVTGVQVVAGGPSELDCIKSPSSTDYCCQSTAQLNQLIS